MAEIGSYAAKTHLPRLLERVRKGERIVITKHGQPVAELVPVTARDPEKTRRALEALRAVRRSLARRDVRLKDLLRPGESLRGLAHAGHRH
jgi:prevent-host-death family protein